MKEKAYAKILTYIGAGSGLILFAVFGMLPGSFLGGVTGLDIAAALLGSPLEAGLAPRMIVAVSMLAGVIISGTMFIVASATPGWLAGTVVDEIKAAKRKTGSRRA